MEDSKHVKSALLIESSADERMQPMLDRRSQAMLPVAGKPVIQFWLEALKQSGIENVHIVVRRFSNSVKQLVGSGERWGLSISVSTLPVDLDCKDSYRHIIPYIDGLAVLAHLDTIPVNNFNIEALFAENLIEETGLSCGSSNHSDLIIVNKDNLKALAIDGETVCKKLVNVDVAEISCPKSYWQANMSLLDKTIHDPLPRGYECDPGISLNNGVQIKPQIEFNPPVRVGKNSMIERDVIFGEYVDIGDNVIIDRGCKVNHAVIFEDSYIGSFSKLSHVIVDGSLICDVESGLWTWINDPAIIGSTKAENNSVSILSRLMAVFLLIVFLPLLLLHMLKSVLSRKKWVIKEQGFIPNGRGFDGKVIYEPITLRSINTDNALFRKVLWMLEVLKGNIHLVGISMIFNNKPDYPEWAHALGEKRPGVLNLHDLEGTNDSTDDKLITDAFYLAKRGLGSDLNLIWRWVKRIFSK